MNLWLIGLVVLGLVVIGGVIVVNISNITAGENAKIDCSTYENACDQNNNCGLQTCEAIQKRTCNCRG